MLINAFQRGISSCGEGRRYSWPDQIIPHQIHRSHPLDMMFRMETVRVILQQVPIDAEEEEKQPAGEDQPNMRRPAYALDVQTRRECRHRTSHKEDWCERTATQLCLCRIVQR